MNIEADRGTVQEEKPAPGRLYPLSPTPPAGPTTNHLTPSPSSGFRKPQASGEGNLPGGSPAPVQDRAPGEPSRPAWLRRVGDYGLALLFVATAALLRWALPEALTPAPSLVFYLAWVGAAAFGGFGPGLLATLASWLCMDFFFDTAAGHIGIDNPRSIARLWIFLAGGLMVSVVGEKMRRSRLRERWQTHALAAANAALQTSEAKYRFLVENSKDVTWTVDLQGRWTFISSNVEAVAGHRADEVLGKTVWDFLAPECQDLVRENLRRRIQGEDVPPYEVLIVGRDARPIPFEVLATPIVDERGNVVGLQGVSRDITERKRAEAALRESERRYRDIVEDQTELICLFEGDGTIQFVNDAYCRYFGMKREALVGHQFLSQIAEEDREFIQAQIAALHRQNPFFAVEHRIRRPDGSITWLEWKNRALFDGQGRLTGYQAVGRDITKRKRAEEALRELNSTLESRVAERTAELEQRARQLQKLTLELTEAEEHERQRLAEILHDDLQQVLAAAKFQVSLLSSQLKHDPAVQEITGQAKSLLAEAIAKSRGLSHELRAPALAQGDFCEAFEWLAEQMQHKHGLTVQLEVGEPLETVSEPLRLLLYKAAQELLFNVVKHARVHEAKLRLRHQRGRFRLTVADQGQGFDPARPGFALGFGLLSIQERVGFLGGRLKIRSAPGRGSIFALTVPDTGKRESR